MRSGIILGVTGSFTGTRQHLSRAPLGCTGPCPPSPLPRPAASPRGRPTAMPPRLVPPGVDSSGRLKQGTLSFGPKASGGGGKLCQTPPAKRSRILGKDGKWNGCCECGDKVMQWRGMRALGERGGCKDARDAWPEAKASEFLPFCMSAQ